MPTPDDDTLLGLLGESFAVTPAEPSPGELAHLHRTIRQAADAASARADRRRHWFRRPWVIVVTGFAVVLGGSTVAVAAGAPVPDQVRQLGVDVGLPIVPPAVNHVHQGVASLGGTLSGSHAPPPGALSQGIKDLSSGLDKLTPAQRAQVGKQPGNLIIQACQKLAAEDPGGQLPPQCPPAPAPPATGTGGGSGGSAGAGGSGATGTSGGGTSIGGTPGRPGSPGGGGTGSTGTAPGGGTTGTGTTPASQPGTPSVPPDRPAAPTSTTSPSGSVGPTGTVPRGGTPPPSGSDPAPGGVPGADGSGAPTGQSQAFTAPSTASTVPGAALTTSVSRPPVTGESVPTTTTAGGAGVPTGSTTGATPTTGTTPTGAGGPTAPGASSPTGGPAR